MDLKGKKVLVTGGAKRVGRAVALAFAKKGADIFLHCRSSETDAKNTAEEIRALGARGELFKADLSKTSEISNLVKSLKANVDILVNSASVFFKTPIESVKESDWDTLLDANLKGPFFLALEIGKIMRSGAGGKIINIADWSGLRPYKDHAPYCISKGGLITMTKALARDLAPKVLSNAVAPGPVLPPPDYSEEEKAAVAKTTALGRWGSPEDVAHAAVFLAESDFINGTVLVVDGGRSIV